MNKQEQLGQSELAEGGVRRERSKYSVCVASERSPRDEVGPGGLNRL